MDVILISHFVRKYNFFEGFDLHSISASFFPSTTVNIKELWDDYVKQNEKINDLLIMENCPHFTDAI